MRFDPLPTPEQPGPGTDPVSGLEGRAIFGFTCANELVLFGSGNPDELQRQVPITGTYLGGDRGLAGAQHWRP